MDLLVWVQRRAIELIRGMEHLFPENRLRELGCSDWRRLHQDIFAAFQYLLKRLYKKDGDRPFSRACCHVFLL